MYVESGYIDDGYFETGLIEVEFTASGGVILAGSAAVSAAREFVASGGALLGGQSLDLREKNLVPAGGFLLGGQAANGYEMSFVPTGGAVLGGLAEVSIYAIGRKFTLGDEVLVIDDAPQRPRRQLDMRQYDPRTAAGHLVPHPSLATDDLLTLHWPRMHADTAAALLAWWRDIARGMAQPFSWRDRGVERQVRFAHPELPEIREVTPDRRAVTITLKVEA